MRFVVTRTSDWLNRHKPCEEAVLETFSGDKQWWIIQLDTLEQLVQFAQAQKHDVVLSAGEGVEPSIEIYDDYRE